jgi:tetratricopeptide (TPR) repeat protein
LRAAQGAGFASTSVHAAIGDCLTRLGRYRESLVAYEQAAAAATDDDSVATAEHKLAIVHDRLGDWPVAQAHLESARDLLASGAASALRARVTADLALVLHRQGEEEQALSVARSALADAEAADDALALAQSHNVLGVLAIERGELPSAIDHLQLSRELAADLDDIGATVAAANNAARAYELAGEYEKAQAAATDALAVGVRHGDRHRIAALHTNLADMLHRHGADAEANVHARAAAEAFASVDDAGVRPQVWTLVEW